MYFLCVFIFYCPQKFISDVCCLYRISYTKIYVYNNGRKCTIRCGDYNETKKKLHTYIHIFKIHPLMALFTLGFKILGKLVYKWAAVTHHLIKLSMMFRDCYCIHHFYFKGHSSSCIDKRTICLTQSSWEEIRDVLECIAINNTKNMWSNACQTSLDNALTEHILKAFKSLV